MQQKPADGNVATSYRIAYERELNPSQLEAVRFREGPVLVVAGAGSGKTRTLTYRVARLVEEGIPPRAILLLTFTRKAAQEMLRRSVELLDSRCGQVAGGTFHSFANSVLRRYGARLGYAGSFCILDRTDCEAIIALLRPEVHPVSTVRKFPTKRTLANIFSKAANKGASVEEVIREDYLHFEPEVGPISQLHQSVRSPQVRAHVHGLRRSSDPIESASGDPRRHPATHPGAIPIRHGGRIPGHQQDPG